MPVPHSRIDAVIFDMDGTLLDTEMVFKAIVFEVAEVLGFEMTEAVQLAMVGNSHERTREILAEAYGSSFPYTLFDDMCRTCMHERMEHAVPIKDGALEFLNELKSRGVAMAVATSSRRPHAEKHLTKAGLIGHFETVVTRDDVVRAKPDPEPFLTAARRLGVAPVRCLAIEDSHSGVRAAAAAGMHTIMVPDLLQPTEEIEALCVAVLPSLVHVHRSIWSEEIA